MSKKIPQRIFNNPKKKEVYKEIVKKSPRKNKTPDQLKLLTNPEDTAQNPLTFSRLMEWLASTGWVEGYVRKRISPMDAHLYEDYAQSVWIVILELKPEYVMEVWYHGKGRFVNFMKRVIDCQLCHRFTLTYNTNKHFHHTHLTLSDEQWKAFEEGIPVTEFTDSYPVKYNCPSGNRKKMVTIEYEDLPIITEIDSITDKQIYIPDELDNKEEGN